jgi:hypothetical protein
MAAQVSRRTTRKGKAVAARAVDRIVQHGEKRARSSGTVVRQLFNPATKEHWCTCGHGNKSPVVKTRAESGRQLVSPGDWCRECRKAAKAKAENAGPERPAKAKIRRTRRAQGGAKKHG